MQFKAEYRSKKLPVYHRTIDADSLNEALKTADRYARKGYICVGVTSTMKG